MVNEGIAGNGVVATVTGQPATRVGHDVLGFSGIDLVVWMAGINDLGAARSTPGPIIAGYQQVVSTLHKAGVKVIGVTLTSSYPPGGIVPANSPLAALAGCRGCRFVRERADGCVPRAVEYFQLTGGIFDATVDFAAVTTDPNTGSLEASFVPNSERTAGDYLHPNRVQAGKEGNWRLLKWCISGMF